MISALAIVSLYALGALATTQSIIHEGGWREARANKEMAFIVGVCVFLWPLFVIFTSVLTMRALNRLKKRKAPHAD